MINKAWFAALLVWLMVSASAIACAGNASRTSTPPVPTPPVTTSAPDLSTLSASTTTRIPPTRSPITTGVITLTLWATQDLAPGTTAAGRILRNQFDAFSAANPNIHLDVVLKKPYGKGGLLDFLLTTNAAVPALLPDLLTLDMSEVPLAAESGVLQPFDSWLPSDLTNDFFPFAYKAARYQNRWVAVPFTADVQHLVYNKATIKKAPATWDDLLRQKMRLLLPLAGDDAFLLQYLALVPSNDLPTPLSLDQTATAQTLNFIKRAHDSNLLADSAIGLKNAEDAWPTFAAGQVPMAQVPASRYLAERDKVPNALYAPVPTRDGKIATLGTGWAFAMTTTDPTRQGAATRFIQWIVQSERLAPWLRAARRLPANRPALILAVEPSEYATFLREQLERATYLPPASSYARQADAWRTAIAAVWRGQITPEEAAQNIVASSK